MAKAKAPLNRGTMQPTKPQRQPKPDLRSPRSRSVLADPDQSQGANTPAKVGANRAAGAALNQPAAVGTVNTPGQPVPSGQVKVDPLYPPVGQSGASGVGPIPPTDPIDPPHQFKPLESVAYQSSMLYGNYDFPRYNSDALIGQRGLAVYDRMMVDEQVKAVLHFKRDAITARPWSFKYEDGEDRIDEDEQQRRINIMNCSVRAMKGSFIDAMNYVLRGLQFGYSLTEKIYDYTEIDGALYYYIREMRAKPLNTFYFVADQYGNLTQFYQLIGGFKNFLDIRKFVYYVHQPEEDWLFGRSELRAAYRSWFSKDAIIKLWNLWMERTAGGFLMIERAPGSQLITQGTPEYNDLMAAMAGITTSSSLLLPEGFKASLVQPGNTDQFNSALVWHNTAIAKSQLVPNLLGVSEQGVHGSLAQSQTQLEAFMWTLTNIKVRLEDTLQEQAFNDVCEQNFGDGIYPKFKFNPISDAQLQWIITQWTTMVGAGVLHLTANDEIWLRKILDAPSITADQIEELDAQKQQNALDIANATKPIASNAAKQESGSPDAGGIKANANTEKAQYRAHTKDGKPRTVTMAAFSRACQRVDFSVIEHRAMMISSSARQTVARAMAKGLARQLEPAHLNDLLKTPELVGQLAFDKSDVARVKVACRAALQNGWNLGQDQAAREIAQAKKLRASRAKFSALDDAAGFLEANSFRMAGNLTDGARAIIQQELLNAIKSGDTNAAQIRTNILERLINKGYIDLAAVSDSPMADSMQALKETLGPDADENKSPYIDTLVRTNVFEAFNEARYAQFKDPDLDGFVVALEYSAILDDRTTEICTELDGVVWDEANPLWDTYRPPNHYNCRSILVPITAVDGWDGKEDGVPGVVPQDGFGAGDK